MLKNSPEQTPHSHFLMGLSAFIFALVMMIQWQFSDLFFASSLTMTVLAALSLVFSSIGYTYLILFFRGVAGRLTQTITCLFFTHFIIHILACPLLLVDPMLSHANIKNPLLLFIGVLYLLITLGLSIWQFVITAHIYKYALGSSAIQSVLAAFGLVAVNILTVSFWR